MGSMKCIEWIVWNEMHRTNKQMNEQEWTSWGWAVPSSVKAGASNAALNELGKALNVEAWLILEIISETLSE